jgi:hypothetical protein
MANPEQAPSKEKKGGLLKSLGRIALVAFGLVFGAEVLEHIGIAKPIRIPKVK